MVEHIFELGDSLLANPESGRIVPELENSQVRECFIYSYRLIYQLADNEVHIMAVIHGKRLLESVEQFKP